MPKHINIYLAGLAMVATLTSALPVSAREDMEQTQAILSAIQNKFDEAVYEMNKAEAAYNNADYGPSCRGYRYAAMLLDDVASGAHSAAYDLSLSVDRRQLLEGEDRAKELASIARENADEVCAKA